MIDAFLVFFLVTLIPIALVGIGGTTEHILFVGWRWLQVGALLALSALVLYQTVRRQWRDLLILLLVGAAVAYVGLSYSPIEWDAQIEYHRVILLADRYGSLTEGYRHGVANWILGYPPGTSLSAMFSSTLHMASPNVAQGLLLLFWSAAFLQRHMRDVDFPGKLAFFVLLALGERMTWHATYFYNNLFYALIWAELVIAPMLGSSFQPWERCAWALVLVWLRPQWQIAAIPIAMSALSTGLCATSLDRRFVRDTLLTTMAALLVAWLGSNYWQTASRQLDAALSQDKSRIVETAAATQHDARILAVDVATRSFAQQVAPRPAPISKQSADAVAWAYEMTRRRYHLSLSALAVAALLGLLTLRRRGLVFIVPLLSPLAIIAATAEFARSYAEYRANEGALERLQLITPILAAGVAAALHRAFRQAR